MVDRNHNSMTWIESVIIKLLLQPLYYNELVINKLVQIMLLSVSTENNKLK